MKTILALFLGVLLASVSGTASANMDSKRADLKQEVNNQLVKTKKELMKMQEEVKDEGTKAKAIQHEALSKLEANVNNLEGKLAAIDQATESDWKSVKADVEKSQKELKQSLDYADDKI